MVVIKRLLIATPFIIIRNSSKCAYISDNTMHDDDSISKCPDNNYIQCYIQFSHRCESNKMCSNKYRKISLYVTLALTSNLVH